MKKALILAAVVLFLFIGTVFAQEPSCTIPVPPLCVCECPTIPACPECPNVTLNCSPTSNVLPGLWEVRFKGSIKCGVVTVYPDQMIIEDQNKSLTWLMADKKTIMQQVEACQ